MPVSSKKPLDPRVPRTIGRTESQQLVYRFQKHLFATPEFALSNENVAAFFSAIALSLSPSFSCARPIIRWMNGSFGFAFFSSLRAVSDNR
jgi:hypothetical protein